MGMWGLGFEISSLGPMLLQVRPLDSGFCSVLLGSRFSRFGV